VQETALAKRATTTTENTRLEANAWLLAGLGQLAEQGINGVKIETLAKRLGVTKGSFYWHFKDRETLLTAMLADWRRRATLDVIDRLERSEGEPADRLRRLLRLPMTGRASEWGADVELAIRLWGRHDPAARAALEEVDEVRLRYIARLIEAAGCRPGEAIARATLAYSYMRVASSLIRPQDTDLMAGCEAILID
jgi:AcrR family transcriptional regulator